MYRFSGWLCLAALTLASSGSLLAQQTQAATNFGTLNIGATTPTQRTISFTGLPPISSLGPLLGTDFSVSNPGSCANGGSCSLVINFNPSRPGLRQDSIILTNASGTIVATAAVYGVGQGPQIAIGPGIVSTLVSRATSALSTGTIGGIAVQATNQFYVTDSTGNQVLYVNAAAGTATVRVSASAGLVQPTAAALDASGNLYVADTSNNLVRMVTYQGAVVSIVAGNGSATGSGGCSFSGAASSANLNQPRGVAVDSQGNLYISDTGNNCIREVLAVNGQVSASSTITTVAGNGTASYGGDGSAATSAEINRPLQIALDSNNNLYIADSANQVIREVSGGTITTVAGNNAAGAGYSGDGAAATSAQLYNPSGVTVDAGGNIYIADTTNAVVRKVDAGGTITTVVGRHAIGYTGDGGAATTATLTNPLYLALDSAANLYVDDSSNYAVREIIATPAPITFASSSATDTLAISNTGNTSLSVTLGAVSSGYTQNSTTCGSSLSAGADCTVILAPTGANSAAGTFSVANNSLASTLTSTIPLYEAAGLRFVPIAPCRAVDTRYGDSFSGSYLVGGSTRTYALPNNTEGCSIPTSAKAYSLNATIVPLGPVTYVTLYPGSQSQPNVSNMNAPDGRTKADAVIVGADANHAINVYASNDTQLLLDVDGYFVDSTDPNYNTTDLVYYPITPCRIADTRNSSYPTGFGPPTFAAQETRVYPILSSTCATDANIPSNVAAYSFNFTAIPTTGYLQYISASPAVQNSSNRTSILNAKTGTVTANAGIIPAGAGGDLYIYASDPADLVIDIDGYFVAASNAASGSGLSLYPSTTPCRAYDSRNSSAFNGTISVSIGSGSCTVPAAAQVYTLNATVLPDNDQVGYITMWPANAAQPLQSTVNAKDGSHASNMALMPTTNGSISVFTINTTNLLLDVFGYWAP